jgi:glucokinase
MSARQTRILAGDIGGTNARLAIYSHQGSRFDLLRRETYSSSEHSCLPDMLARFLKHDGGNVDAACLGLPTPIHSGIMCPPNLPWQVDRERVFQTIGTDRVALINDVEASAAGIEGLPAEDLVVLQTGHVDPAGNRAVIALGTGFGVSAITPSGRTFATEAGHASFSPSSERDFELQARLQREYGHVSWERIVAGSGLPDIHALLAPEHSPRLEAREIVRRAASDNACRESVEIFRRHIGTVAGNIALTLMATGGLYLTGGAATSVLNDACPDRFMGSFCDKGRMRPLLERIPVYLVPENNLGLRGAARTAIERFAAPRNRRETGLNGDPLHDHQKSDH